MLHSNPYKGMYGHEKDGDWIKVDLPYLQSLGHGALDPDLMQKTLMERYAASAKAESEIRAGRGAEARGGGINMLGTAAEVKAGDERALLPAKENLLNEQAGQASRSPQARTAAANGAPPKMTWSVYNATKNHTAALADSLQLGQKVPVPQMIPDPRHPGKMIPNTDYAPGKMMLDSSKIPPVLRGISDEDRPRLNSMAGEFHAANMGRISDYDAVDLAARVVKDQRAAPKDRVHEDPSSVKPPNAPGSGKKLKNVIHSSDGRVHIWVGPGPMDYKTIRERADHDYGNPGPGIPVDSGGGPGATSGVGGGGMGDDPDNTAMLDASSGP
jgi:hypothetical protein